MKLLIITQAVDSEDPVLGFFVRWIEELAKYAESIEVICLKEGKHSLPSNVRVHSLGKEKGVSKAGYVFNFYRYIWWLRNNYDAVFVHMNQEYVLMGGWFWKLWRKPTYLWRNHYAGSYLTDSAAAFCTKVFCTSKHSYTAKYAKTVIMPVGVDVERFYPDARIVRVPRSILFLSRMSPSKRPDMLIDALAMLAQSGSDFTATFVGSPLPKDETYYEDLKEKIRSLSLTHNIGFLPGVPNSATPDLYRAHEIFVNCSSSGMFDKTLFEAMGCEDFVLAASKDLEALIGERYSFKEVTDLTEKIRQLLALSQKERALCGKQLREVVKKHDIVALTQKLVESMGVQDIRHALTSQHTRTSIKQ